MRILIADDHSIVRMGLTLMLEAAYPNVKIDEVENGVGAVEKIKATKYDLAVLDFQMPNTDTFSTISNLLARDADLKILIFTMASEKIYGPKLLNAGVRGFVSKEAANGDLLKAVAAVLRGAIFTNAPANELSAATDNTTSPFAGLSNKEMDVLAYLVQGKTTKEISTLLSLQLSTISTHKFRIYKKLNVTNLAELLALTRVYPLY